MDAEARREGKALGTEGFRPEEFIRRVAGGAGFYARGGEARREVGIALEEVAKVDVGVDGHRGRITPPTAPYKTPSST